MRLTIVVFLFLIGVSPLLRGQAENAVSTPITGLRTQPFFFEALNFAQSDQFGYTSRLDLYVQVPFDNIGFVKKDNLFVGGYSMTLRILDEEERLIKEETWTRSIQQKKFETTVDPGSFDVSQRSFVLDPGQYLLEMTLEDKESRKSFRFTKQVTVRGFDKNVTAISDIMLVSRVMEHLGKRSITPQIDANVADLAQGFSLFYEFYNPYDIGSVRIHYRIQRQGLAVTTQSQVQPVRKGPNSYVTRIPTQDLGFGAYLAEILLTHPDDSLGEKPLAKGLRPFTIEWTSGIAAIAITNLDDAVEQMRYFANSEDLDSIRNAPDDKEKRRRFEAFWERHNPIPGSPLNRAMVEYYKRVEYANSHFKHYVAGWKSDRGMVYIIYGPPSYVDRHPFEVDSKPYEVWEYYDVNKRFIFVDDTGFGEYRLLYPIWDDRNRLR